MLTKMVENIDEKIYAYALDNACNHGGKAQEGAVLSHLFKDGLQKEEINQVMPRIKEMIKKVNSLTAKELEEAFSNYKKDFEKLREIKQIKYLERELPELPNAIEGKMVFRLAPYPSGALHIGNAKTYTLNALYAEKYKAKTLLVMDDTIGSEKKQIAPEAYDLIEEGFKWIGVSYNKPVIYKSDRLEIYYEYGKKLLEMNKAYVCHCKQETLGENRAKGIDCECRNIEVGEQMKRWEKMFKSKPGSAVVRIKTSMQNPNPAFRDRVLFKIADRKHPRVGKKYSVWPTLEMSWAIDDHLLEITHIIRGNDLVIETDMEKFIWDIFGWKHPDVIHVGLVRIEGAGAKISKSKAQKEVRSGEFTGWDDPRTWSLQSLKRRGIKPEAFKEFIKEIGLNKVDIIVPIGALYSLNKKIIDSEANRYYFVENPKKITIENFPKTLNIVELPIHPDKTELRKIKVGSTIHVSNLDFEENKGKEIRLQHLFNVEMKEKTKMLDSSDKTVQKLQWVPEKFKVKAKILMTDGTWISGLAEKNIEKLKVGDIIQFERVGFCRFDKKKGNTYEFWFTHK